MPENISTPGQDPGNLNPEPGNVHENISPPELGQTVLQSSIESEISFKDPQTENMETHAHELHKAPGHGWKHYFSEFFMLFLAVFCGFLAENVRESSVERSREKNISVRWLKTLSMILLSSIIKMISSKRKFH